MDVDPAGRLTAANLLYREPALHDEFVVGSTVADNVLALVDGSRTPVRSVLDLGCGTGHVLAALGLRRGWRVIGVDLQPGLVDHARRAHPAVELHVGDLRTVRLGIRAELVLCLGNTLAYLPEEPDLAAAFATVAAHAACDAMIVIATLTGAAPDAHGISPVRSVTVGDGEVETRTRHDVRNRRQTMTRTWRLADGRVERDRIVRRIWDRGTLVAHAGRAGLGAPVFLE